MSQNKTFSPIETLGSENPPLSREMEDIITKTHSGALNELPDLESEETNLIRITVRNIRTTLEGLKGNELNPQRYSDLTTGIIALRNQKAASEEKFKQAA